MAQGIKIEEERIETIRNWLEPQSIRDIQVFLSFANFYRRFIRNFNRIATPLTSIFQTIDDETLSTQATKNEKNQDALGGDDGTSGDANINNQSTAANVAKSKKPTLTKTKKSDFAKVNSSGTDCLTQETKKAFIYLQKTFTKTPTLWHFDPEHYIHIKTVTL